MMLFVTTTGVGTAAVGVAVAGVRTHSERCPSGYLTMMVWKFAGGTSCTPGMLAHTSPLSGTCATAGDARTNDAAATAARMRYLSMGASFELIQYPCDFKGGDA